jgi:hypothetical protein
VADRCFDVSSALPPGSKCFAETKEVLIIFKNKPVIHKKLLKYVV